MEFINTTVGQSFQLRDHFRIPVYQRAYSWNKDQWSVFLDDLNEQSNQGNTYSYGNLLLEKITPGKLYEIIDGQQRITTLIIFMRALINVLKGIPGTDQALIEDLQGDFIGKNGSPKLETVFADRACFNELIVQNRSTFSTTTRSQENIKEAKEYFTTELSKLGLDRLLLIKDVVLDAKMVRMEMTGKQEAALMFELQNNRGKDLTNLEKLKSYFMYQMYVHSRPEEAEGNIQAVADSFVSIYSNIKDLGRTIDEDSLLRYHCFAYLPIAFAYRNLDDITKEFRKSANKVKWIQDFVYELTQTFTNIKQLNNCKDAYFLKLKKVDLSPFAYTFIIKGLKYFGTDTLKMRELYKLLECVVFRVRIIASRADFNSRMSECIRAFNGDIDQLQVSINQKLKETPYWSDSALRQMLEGNLYGRGLLNYILWEYEVSLAPKGYVAKSIEIVDEAIEHISPRTPTKPDETLASGYDVDSNNKYSQTFLDKYLNCIGNLMLISTSQNSKAGNHKFSDKLASYEQNKLLSQQQEIREFVRTDPPSWKTKQIEERRDKIVKFCMNRWKIV